MSLRPFSLATSTATLLRATFSASENLVGRVHIPSRIWISHIIDCREYSNMPIDSKKTSAMHLPRLTSFRL